MNYVANGSSNCNKCHTTSNIIAWFFESSLEQGIISLVSDESNGGRQNASGPTLKPTHKQ
jgi:hypothetical protein